MIKKVEKVSTDGVGECHYVTYESGRMVQYRANQNLPLTVLNFLLNEWNDYKVVYAQNYKIEYYTRRKGKKGKK